MASRSRKPRVVWLPPDMEQDQFPNAFTSGNSTIWGLGLAVSGVAPIFATEHPLVIDSPRDPATESLADLEDSSYRLRRIVGQIWINGDRLDEESGVETIHITCGIIVRRVDQSGIALAMLADNTTGDFSNTSASCATNSGDPWIWMRSWRIAVPLFTLDTTSTPSAPRAEAVDFAYHLDQKTARIVGPEERLFFHASAMALGGGQGELTNLTIISGHIRCLGTLRSSSGNRRNASR